MGIVMGHVTQKEQVAELTRALSLDAAQPQPISAQLIKSNSCPVRTLSRGIPKRICWGRKSDDKLVEKDISEKTAGRRLLSDELPKSRARKVMERLDRMERSFRVYKP